MKRILSLALALVLCLCSLVGCKAPEPKNLDHTADGQINILMIGNSFSWYFTDELYQMLVSSGYENVSIYTIFRFDGNDCPVSEHYQWWKEGLLQYKVQINDSKNSEQLEYISLEQTLELADWDVISFQERSLEFLGGTDSTMAGLETPLGELYQMISGKFPKAKFLWHQTWAYEVGFADGEYKVETVQQRQDIARVSQDVSQRIAEKYGMTVVPTATAWEAVRDNGVVLEDERFPGDFSLTSRFMAGGVYSFDKYHDGDIGGGQYLNACVWYETLTGLSCKENKFLPSYDLDGTLYSLSGKKIKLLQKTAHNAVANNK